ncbi:MAG TPA: universal stress protein [Acidobacteriaceae bacterium]|nr:universal stress protein [Acidobacteriaceae bacterium]
MATLDTVAVTFAHILVPTDFSDVSERALEYAKTLAKPGNSELLLVHVDPPVNLITPPEAAWIDDSEIQAMHQEQLEQTGLMLVSQGYRAQAIELNGPLYDQLLHAIEEYKVDLIVLGTHGRKGFDRLLLGSDAEALLRHARCPVLSVGPGVSDLGNKAWTIREILCAITLEPHAAEVAAYAHKLAAQTGAELVFFHIKNPGNQKDSDWSSFEKSFHDHAHAEAKYSFLHGKLANGAPGTSIVEVAKERRSDLIVMGVRPTAAIRTHLPPGIAAKVLMEAPCPVMTLLQY